MASPAVVLPSFYITIATANGATTKRIEGDLLSVGRGRDCNLAIDHESMSRRHVSVTLKRGECWVEDHGSAHGTFINGTRLLANSPARVKPEDQVILAQSGVKLMVSAEPFMRQGSSPPLPQEVKTSPGKAIATTTIEQRHETRVAAIPETRLPHENQQKAETLVLEAYKKAAHLVHEAEIEAERRVEEIYRRAHDTQAKTDAAYQKRLNEAYRAAETAFQSAQSEAQEILANGRERAVQLRDQAEKFVTDLRQQTERDCELLLEEAQAVARDLKNARLLEADESARRKEQQLILAATTAMNERLLKFEADLAEQSERRRQQIDQELQSTLKTLEQLKLETQDLEQKKAQVILLKAEIEKAQNSLAGNTSQLGAVRGELEKLEKARATTREQLNQAQEQLNGAESRVKSLQRDTQTQMLNLRAKFEEDKVKWLKDEQRRLEEMKLETARKARDFEKDLFEEVQFKKDRLGREVALLVETQLKDAPKNKTPDLKHMEASITKLVNDQLVVMAKDKTTAQKQRSLVALRRREKAWHYFAGGVFGAALALAAQHITQLNLDVSPIQNKIVSALEQQRLDLEKRKFNPPQSRDFKMTHTDNVIYTEHFTAMYLSDDYQDALLKEASPYLLRMWRVDEDKAIQLLAMNAALVKALADKKDAIHPDFVNPSIEKMRAFEKESTLKMAELLGSQVRLESFKKFEAQFFNSRAR